MKILKPVLVTLLATLLTVLTQTGGIAFLTSILTFRFIDRKFHRRWARVSAKFLSFATLYLTLSFVIVPLAAKSFGRVPLPILEERSLKPGNVWTCLLNRHYVNPELREITFKVAQRISDKYPGATVNYLDANFPFIHSFPLWPHLSHDDGKKLDLSFQYNNANTGRITNGIPSFIGYGICEEPRAEEENKPAYCESRGYWQYNLLRDIMSQGNKKDFNFDNDRTRELINSFVSQDAVGKIFVEPHLTRRLGLTSNKIRFHGCQAVRHDDHIHVQLR